MFGGDAFRIVLGEPGVGENLTYKNLEIVVLNLLVRVDIDPNGRDQFLLRSGNWLDCTELRSVIRARREASLQRCHGISAIRMSNWAIRSAPVSRIGDRQQREKCSI